MKTNLLLTAVLSLSLSTASTAQTLPAYLPTDGLVGWWPFNGNANDESGNNFNLFNTGANLHPDRFGNNNQSYWVGNGGYLTYTGPSITGGESFTYSFWMKTNQNLNEYQDWIFSEDGENENGIPTGIWFVFRPMSKNLDIVHPAVSYAGILNYPFPGIDEWHHVVVEGPVAYRVYIDGQLASTGSSQYFPIANEITFRIGAFNGAIDDFAAYNRQLSYEEIQALYAESSTQNPPIACNPLPTNLQNGLIGYWPFCGNANDESGNGNNGMVNGATLTEDRFGVSNSAYVFDGESTFIQVNPIETLNNSSNLTISAFIKPQGLTGTRQFIVSRGYDYTSGGFFLCHENNQNADKLRFSINGYGNFNLLTEDSFPIPYSDWQHVTVVKSPNSIKLYVNGNLDNVSTYSDNLLVNNDSIYFGVHRFQNQTPGWFPYYFNGSLDDIGIWNRALSPEEVQQLYTLNACTFTIYDTVTVENVVTVYDTVLTSVTDTLIINTLITELAPPANTNTIKVFPNPAGSILTIDYGNFALMNGYQLRIENSLGQEVFQTNINQQSDTLSLGTWGGNGLYFVHIVDPQGNTIDIRKIVLQ